MNGYIASVKATFLSKAAPKLAQFQRRLILSPTPILGVKTQDVKAIAKQLLKQLNDQITAFICQIPVHEWLEWDLLKGFLLVSLNGDVTQQLALLNDFSYEIDNWAVCDMVVCHSKWKSHEVAQNLSWIEEMLHATQYPFRVRFGILFLLKYYAQAPYFSNTFSLIEQITLGEYYVDMAVAWLLSLLLIRDEMITLQYMNESKHLSDFVYQKGLQKAIESKRITETQKATYRELKKRRKEESHVRF